MGIFGKLEGKLASVKARQRLRVAGMAAIMAVMVTAQVGAVVYYENNTQAMAEAEAEYSMRAQFGETFTATVHDRADEAARAAEEVKDAEQVEAEAATRAEEIKALDTSLRWNADANEAVEAAQARAAGYAKPLDVGKRGKLPAAKADGSLIGALISKVRAAVGLDEPAATQSGSSYATRVIAVFDEEMDLREGDEVLGTYGNAVLIGVDSDAQLKDVEKHYRKVASAVGEDTEVDVADANDAGAASAEEDAEGVDDNAFALASATETDGKHAGAVALIDTGAPENDTHVVASYNVAGGEDKDSNGHATQMARVLEEGSPDVEIVSIKALGDDGKGSISDIYAAVELARELGCTTVNMSFAGKGSGGVLTAACEDARRAGATLVAAAGNGGHDADDYTPGNIVDTYTVGMADANGKISKNSNKGACVDAYVSATSTSAAAAKVSAWLSAGNTLDTIGDSGLVAVVGVANSTIGQGVKDAQADGVEAAATIYWGVKDATLYLSSTSNSTYGATSSTDGVYSSYSAVPWYSQRASITTVKVLNKIYPTSTAYWFYEFTYLHAIRNIENLDTSSVTNMTSMFRYCSSFTTLDLSALDTSQVTSMYEMFSNCSALTTLDLSSFNTSSVTSMIYMFRGCSSLTTLDVSKFDTSKVTNMNSMFQSCPKLTTLDVSNFDTSKVTNMGYMFYNCSSLTTLDLSSFDTSKVTSMSNMFYNCSSLTTLDVSNFDTSQVTSMYEMFRNCSALTTIYASSLWSTAKVASSNYMFTSCSKLVGGNGTTYSSSYVTATRAVIDKSGQVGYLTEKANPTIYWGIKDATLYLSSTSNSTYNCTNSTTGVFETYHTAPWYSQRTSITSVNILNKINPSRTTAWFNDLEKVKQIINLENINTSNVKNMAWMFCGLKAMTAPLDASCLDTHNVTTMFGAFAYLGCTSINVTGLDTSKVTDMGHVFIGCTSITALDLSDWDTSKAYTMDAMFQGCTNLTTIYVSDKWSTASVITSSGTFTNSTKLKGGNGTAYNASYVDKTRAVIDKSGQAGYLTQYTATFYWGVKDATLYLSNTSDSTYNCTNSTNGVYSTASAVPWYSQRASITTVKVLDKVRPSSTAHWFYYCSSLTTLDLSTLDTSQVTTMSSMFYCCTKFTTLDLSSFDTSNVTNMYDMFYNCTSLTTIYASSLWSTAKVTSSNYMFTNCTKLKGGNGTTFSSSYTTATRAKIDKPGQIGYLTQVFYWGVKDATLYLSSTPVSTYDCTNSTTGVYSSTSAVPWYSQRESITAVKVLNKIYPTSTTYWFSACRYLTTLDLSNLNTSSVTAMNSMFSSCTSLTTLDLSSFDTSSVTSMHAMFYNCTKLTTLDVSNFDTSKVTDMYGMFQSCSSLITLDLSSFDTSQVTTMSSMFYYCSSLTTIYASSLWSTANVTSSASMFYSCTKLVGGNGTTYSSSYVDKTRAVIDKPGQVGYLTDIVSAPIVSAPIFWGVKDGTLYLSSTSNSTYDCTNSTNGVFSSGSAAPWYSQRTSITTVKVLNKIHPTSTAYWFYYCSSLKTCDLSNLNTSQVTDMSSMFEYTTALTTLDLSSFDTSQVTSMHSMFEYTTSLTTLDLSFFDTSQVTNMAYMFRSCSSLTTLDVSNFDTSRVTTMYQMFYACFSLTTLDASSFDTSQVIDMSWMFNNCSALTTIYASSLWSTAKVTSSNYMFTSCTKLVGGNGTTYSSSYTNKTRAVIDKSGQAGYLTDIVSAPIYWGVKDATLYLSSTSNSTYNCTNSTTGVYSSYNAVPWYSQRASITTVKVLNKIYPSSTARWFYGCSKLATLDVSKFDTSQVTTMNSMFESCSSLTTLDLSSFDTSKVTTMQGMFWNCPSLITLDVSNFNTSQVTDMFGMFLNCSSLTTIYASSLWSTAKVTNSTDMFYSCTKLKGGNGTAFNSSYVDKTRAVIDKSVQVGYLTERVVSSKIYWGIDGNTLCLSSTKTDICLYDTNGKFTVAADAPWYKWQSFITSVNIVNYLCPKQVDYWFRDYSKITSFTNMSYLDTSEITNMSYMFYNCNSLTALDLSSFDTSKVIDMTWMFGSCSSLTTLDVSNFNTSKVTTMYSMFQNCTSFTTLDLSSFDTSQVTSMALMFTRCSSLTTLDLSTLDTSQVTTMSSMFYYCSSLTTLDVSKFNTSNVTTMGYMFQSCSSLITLDLSSFDTSNVTSMFEMFRGCPFLTTIYASSLWSTAKVTSSNYMFTACTKLVGGNGTTYSSSYVTATRALIDRPGQVGYLTQAFFWGYKDGTLYMSSTPRSEYDCVVSTTGVYSSSSAVPWYSLRGSITSVNFLDTFYPTSTAYWFYYFQSMSALTNVTNLDTSCVKDMSYMFYCCNSSSLTSLDLSTWTTPKVTNMSNMFYSCSTLTSLDLSGFTGTKVTDSSYMFYCCSTLKTIYVDNTWNTSASSTYMFYYCIRLVGGDGTTYNSSYTTATRAQVDTVSKYGGTAGYFTAKYYYNITYDLNDTYITDTTTASSQRATNSELNPARYSKFHLALPLQAPTRNGYTFLGWSMGTNSTYSTNMSIPTTATTDQKFTARWSKPITYSISYSGQASTVEGNPTGYTVEQTVNIANPERTGYDFAGWTGTGITGTSKVKNLTLAQGTTGNRTYTANWTATLQDFYVNVYHDGVGVGNAQTSGLPSAVRGIKKAAAEGVAKLAGSSDEAWGTFDLKKTTGGVTTTLNDITEWSGEVDYDSTYAITDVKPIEGKLFNTAKSGPMSGTVSGETEVNLFFDTRGYDISYDLAGGNFGTRHPTKYTPLEAAAIDPPTRTGYTFAGWTLKVTNDSGVTTTSNITNTGVYEIEKGKTGTHAFTAKWTANAYSVRYHGTQGVATAAPEGTEYALGDGGESYTQSGFAYDTEKALAANTFARAHYSFASWNTAQDGTGDNYAAGEKVKNLATGADGDETAELYAQWTPVPYRISYSLAGGTVEGNPSTYTVEDTITLVPPSKKGYTFAGWTGTGIDEPEDVHVIEAGTYGNLVFRATWKPVPTFTNVQNSAGGVAVAKVSSEDGSGISGAKITVYSAASREAADAIGTALVAAGYPNAVDADALEAAGYAEETTVTTGADGVASTGSTDLDAGWYAAVETGAPAGYELTSAPQSYSFEVSGWGNVATVDAGGSNMTFTNDPDGSLAGGVAVKKVASGSGEGLEDAEFDVYKTSDVADAITQWEAAGADRGTIGSWLADTDATPVASITTGEDGIARTSAYELPYANYTVVESDAPGGYTINATWRKSFDVTQSGVVVDLTGEPCEDAIKTGSYQIRVKKELSGATLEAGQFQFELHDASGALVETARNDADGNITFTKVDVDASAIGTTVRYTINEVNDGQQWMDYSDTVIGVEVSISDEGAATLSATYAFDYDENTFYNYKIEPYADVPLTGGPGLAALLAACGAVLVGGGTALYALWRRGRREEDTAGVED